MPISEAAKRELARLSQSGVEGATDIANAITRELESIDAKNFTLIGEKRTEVSKKLALSEALTAVSGALGVDRSQPLEALIGNLTEVARTVKRERDESIKNAEKLQTKADELEMKTQKFETDIKRNDLAGKIGVDPVVFGDLFEPDTFDKFKVTETGVTFDGKDFSEHVRTDERLSRYQTLLNSAGDSGDNTPPKDKPKETRMAPGNPPKPDKNPPADPLSAYLSKTYS